MAEEKLSRVNEKREQIEKEVGNQLPCLIPIGAFGLSYADKNHTIVTIGDDIVYSAGKYMVLYRRDQTCAPRMRISQPDLSVTHITSMTTAPDHSRVAAIEQLEGEQRISFWDCNMHCTQPPIACSVQGQLWDAAWSQDCQYIAGSTIRARSNNETKVAVPRPGQDAGSWKSCMYYWRQDSSLVGSVECHHRIKKIIVDPANSAYIISLGVDGQATFWRCSKSELTPVPVAGLHANSRGDFVEPNLKCTAIAGLANGLTLVTTNHASMFVIDRLRVIKKYSELDGVITELTPLEDRSFVAVVHEKQRLDLYVNELDHEEVAAKRHSVPFRLSSVTENQEVVSLTATADHKHVSLHTRHVGCLSLCVDKNAGQPTAQADPWLECMPGFHTHAIVALSVATRRTLLATASRDNTVRVWDYHAQISIAMYQAANPVMCVSLHPWGTDIIISFYESAFTYVVGGNELIKGQRLAESASGFSQLQYNPSGSMLAAVRKEKILIYTSLKYDLVATLAGHADSVCDVAWSDNGFLLATACHSSVYLWRMDTFARIEEDTTRTWSNASILPEGSFRSMMVADAFYGARHFATTRSTPQDADAARHSGAVEITELVNSSTNAGSGAVGAAADGVGSVTMSRGAASQPSNSEKMGAAEGRGGAGGGTGEIPSLQLLARGLQGIRRPLTRMVRSKRHKCVFATVGSEGSDTVAVGGDGRVRIFPFPPCNDVALEATPHRGPISALAVDAGGDLVFTADVSGMILIQVLVPRTGPITPEQQADIDQGKDIQETYQAIYERALGVLKLANPVRENRALACVYLPEDLIDGMKTEIRYLEEGSRVHQTEMEWLRMKMQHKHEHEITVLKQRHDLFEKDSKQVMDELIVRHREEVAEVLKRGSEQKASFVERLDEQQDWVEKRLAREIERTDLAESEAHSMKVKFASHLKRLQGSVRDAENAHATDVDAMHKKIAKLQTDAGAVLEQRRAKLDLEVLLEASLNDEDIERTRKNAQAVLAERDRRFMKLFADYQLQKTHIARAIVDTKTADHRREEAEREAQRLQSKVERLEKQAELAKKRDAERSEREEMEARLKIDNEERMRRLATFQELASNRMAIQQQHLGPLMVNLKQSHAELTEAENLQTRNLRRFEKLLWHQQDLKDALDTAKREAAASQEEAANSRQFTAGLLGNVWRVIHEESPERWAAIFGKMYADHYKGKEPKKWTASSVPTPIVPATAVATSTTTTPEQRQEHAITRFTQLQDDPKAVEVLLKETTDNLLSAERLIGYLQSSRRLAQSGRDSTKATMVATNSNLLKVLNDLQRENHTLRQRLDAQAAGRQDPSPSFGGDMPPRNSLPPRPSISYFQKLLGAPGTSKDEAELSVPSPSSACALEGDSSPSATGVQLPATGNRKVQRAHAHAQRHHVPSDVAPRTGASELEEDFPDHLGDPLADAPNAVGYGTCGMEPPSLMDMPPEGTSLPPRPSTVPAPPPPTSDGDMVLAPGMPAPAASHGAAASMQRAVTFAQLRARDSELGFGSVASSGVLRILDTGPRAVTRASSAVTSGGRADDADTGGPRTRPSSRPAAARPGASAHSAAVHASHSLSAPHATLPARPRTVGSGFRTTSAVRGSAVAVSERGRFLSSEYSQAHRCAAAGSANDSDGNCGMAPAPRGRKSPDRRGVSAGAHVAAGASIGIDVRHVQRQVRSALQHGGDLIVEVGSVMDGGSVQDSTKPERTNVSAKGFKGRPDPAQTGMMKELLGSHNPSLGREGLGKGAQKR